MKSSFWLIMLLAGTAVTQADDGVTLRIADQKGNMRAQLEAAHLLKNLPYHIEWAECPAAAPLAEALYAGAVDVGIIGDTGEWAGAVDRKQLSGRDRQRTG